VAIGIAMMLPPLPRSFRGENHTSCWRVAGKIHPLKNGSFPPLSDVLDVSEVNAPRLNISMA
jgi:hypothetical protein